MCNSTKRTCSAQLCLWCISYLIREVPLWAWCTLGAACFAVLSCFARHTLSAIHFHVPSRASYTVTGSDWFIDASYTDVIETRFEANRSRLVRINLVVDPPVTVKRNPTKIEEIFSPRSYRWAQTGTLKVSDSVSKVYKVWENIWCVGPRVHFLETAVTLSAKVLCECIVSLCSWILALWYKTKIKGTHDQVFIMNKV